MAIAPEITNAPAPYNIPSHTRRRPADPIPLTPILPRSRCGSPAPCNSHVSRCRVCVLTRSPSPLTIVAQSIHRRIFSNGWVTSEEDPQPTHCPSPTRQGQSPPDKVIAATSLHQIHWAGGNPPAKAEGRQTPRPVHSIPTLGIYRMLCGTSQQQSCHPFVIWTRYLIMASRNL